MATLESIQARIAKLQMQAAALATKNATAILERIRGLMDKHDITVADIEAHVSGGRGRKSRAPGAGMRAASAAKYRDPKTGATWTGHGRAPSWIATAKDRTKFLIVGESKKSAADAKTAAKTGRYVRGPQPPMYRDPKTGATWSGRGRAPAWLANAKDRTKFLIAGIAAGTEEAAVAKTKSAPAKKQTAKTSPTKKSTSKKVATKKTASKKAASKRTAVKKATAKKSQAAAKKPSAKKAAVKRAAGKKAAAKKAVGDTAPAVPLLDAPSVAPDGATMA